MTPRAEAIHARLTEALSPSRLDIFDDSMTHAGHVGAAQGGGHFQAIIVAAAFAGKSLVQRHQMVYRALGDMLHGDIHAFSMKVYTPDEYPSPKEATQ